MTYFKTDQTYKNAQKLGIDANELADPCFGCESSTLKFIL